MKSLVISSGVRSSSLKSISPPIEPTYYFNVFFLGCVVQILSQCQILFLVTKRLDHYIIEINAFPGEDKGRLFNDGDSCCFVLFYFTR